MYSTDEVPRHSPFSLKSVRLGILNHEGIVVETASGFFYRQDQESELSLVTNYHVVSGRNTVGVFNEPWNVWNQPVAVRIYLPDPVLGREGQDPQRQFDIQLAIDDDGILRRQWYSRYRIDDAQAEFKDRFWGPDSAALGPEADTYPDQVVTDIAVLPITYEQATEFQLKKYAHTWDRDDMYIVRPTDMVYVVGYPKSVGELHSPTLPIWTTGSVANEVEAGPHGRFFIDSRTRPGQSGSPVFSYRPEMDINGPVGLSYVPEAAMLLGVYSGRADKDADIGSVWWISQVNQLVSWIPEEARGPKKVDPLEDLY